jgi:hypothetical protein
MTLQPKSLPSPQGRDHLHGAHSYIRRADTTAAPKAHRLTSGTSSVDGRGQQPVWLCGDPRAWAPSHCGPATVGHGGFCIQPEDGGERESMAVTIHFLNTTRVPLGEHLSVPLRNAHHKVSSEDAKGSRGLGWPSEVPLGDGDE